MSSEAPHVVERMAAVTSTSSLEGTCLSSRKGGQPPLALEQRTTRESVTLTTSAEEASGSVTRANEGSVSRGALPENREGLTSQMSCNARAFCGHQ